MLLQTCMTDSSVEDILGMSFVLLVYVQTIEFMVSNVVCLPTFYETFSVSQNKESYTGLEWHEGE